jgi:hypothetical protein
MFDIVKEVKEYGNKLLDAFKKANELLKEIRDLLKEIRDKK